MRERQRSNVSQLSDSDLERGFTERVQRDRTLTAELLVYLGEMIGRRLYAPAGYPSMYQYCVQRCGMSADVAFKWTRAARLARRFPVILDMIEDGRLNLTAITMLSSRLDAETAPWLLPAAAGKSTRDLRALLATHWPQPDAPTVVKVIAVKPAPRTPSSPAPPAAPDMSSECPKLAARPVLFSDANPEASDDDAPLAQDGSHAPAETAADSSPTNTETTAPDAREHRYLLQCTLDEQTYELLELARSLSVPGPDSEVTAVLKAALQEHVRRLEQRKFAATERPQASRRASDPATVQNHVKRAVWKRDQGRCTFIGDDGRQCGERQGLEYDHAIPLARGGDSRVANVRLRCRTHNQLEADRVLGQAFMDGKRAAAAASAASG